jgi:hypothetical protein
MAIQDELLMVARHQQQQDAQARHDFEVLEARNLALTQRREQAQAEATALLVAAGHKPRGD